MARGAAEKDGAQLHQLEKRQLATLTATSSLGPYIRNNTYHHSLHNASC